MGFGLWIDETEGVAWAQGTHEYRPMGSAVISITDQFLPRDFRQSLHRPADLDRRFTGIFASLEDVNRYLRSRRGDEGRRTPAYVR